MRTGMLVADVQATASRVSLGMPILTNLDYVGPFVWRQFIEEGVMFVPIDDGWSFTEADDEADRAAVDAAMAEDGPNVSLEDLRAELGL
jgi:hypothetical protein